MNPRLGLITVFLSCVSSFFSSSAVLLCNCVVVGVGEVVVVRLEEPVCQDKWSRRSPHKEENNHAPYLSGLGDF